MKKLYLLFFITIMIPDLLHSQCTNTVVDWDYRDFFSQDNTTIRNYVSQARAQEQYFAFGANKLTITHNYTLNNVKGDNTTHTGSAGSYGTSGAGADIQFVGNGTITLRFDDPVTDLRFSLFDVDRNQRVSFDARNGVTPLSVSLATVSGTTLAITNNNTPTAYVVANSTTVANSSTSATVNVSVAGPVTSVTLTINYSASCTSSCGTGGTEDRSFWLSDIYGCTVSSFPDNYYEVSRPFTGMPGYVLAVRNNVFYYVDPATGRSKYLFTDYGHTNINSMSYDPYRRYVYYTYSLSGSGGNGTNPDEKSLRRYHYDMDTLGVLVANVNTLGIPTYENGVETAAAAFYGDKLYLGIEGGSNYTESNIWRIDLSADQLPVGISQVYSQPPYVSGNRTQDWSDFGINNGVLYDFDAGAAGSGTNKDFHHQNLFTGVVTRYLPSGTLIPRQVSVDWQGTLYNVGSPSSVAAGTIAPYNGTNNVGTARTITYDGVTVVGSWGDAAEAFRPFCDFGDAPESYDPDPWSPAVHERDTSLRLGPTFDREWLKTSSIDATADGSDEDGISTVPLFDPGESTYSTQVTVYNNTGSDATVIGWLDYDGNGFFDTYEASVPVTVPSAGPFLQTIYLNWSGIASTLPVGSYTYLRIRVTSADYNMDAGKSTGYYDGGETEDYRVIVDNTVLPVVMISFDATVENNSKVKLNWQSYETANFSGYEVERSRNGTDWEVIGYIPGKNHGEQSYQFTDAQPKKGNSSYRLRLLEEKGNPSYSTVRSVRIIELTAPVTIFPNPAKDQASISIQAERSHVADLRITGPDGKQLIHQKLNLVRGVNTLTLPIQSSWLSGTYFIQVGYEGKVNVQKLILERN